MQQNASHSKPQMQYFEKCGQVLKILGGGNLICSTSMESMFWMAPGGRLSIVFTLISLGRFVQNISNYEGPV